MGCVVISTKKDWRFYEFFTKNPFLWQQWLSWRSNNISFCYQYLSLLHVVHCLPASYDENTNQWEITEIGRLSCFSPFFLNIFASSPFFLNIFPLGCVFFCCPSSSRPTSLTDSLTDCSEFRAFEPYIPNENFAKPYLTYPTYLTYPDLPTYLTYLLDPPT